MSLYLEKSSTLIILQVIVVLRSEVTKRREFFRSELNVDFAGNTRLII